MIKLFNNPFFLFFVLLLGCNTPEKPKITIATAANVQFAMEELTQVFSRKTGVFCEIILNSSGKLSTQIKSGAPYDLFVSADMKYPEDLAKSGFGQNTPKVYAYGKLVLWTIKAGLKPSLDLLKSENIKHIALANPETAPYGEAALACLRYFKLEDSLKSKLVYGESIAQTNQFITSQTAELGFTAKSVVLSPEMKDKGKWIELDEKSYQAIAQGVIVLKNKDETKRKNAEKFYEFLFSAEAKKILEKYGYRVNPA